MAKKPIRAGKTYKIVGSANGPEGSCVGRKCIAIQEITGVPHTLWGVMWLVESADGVVFEFIHQPYTDPETNEHFPEKSGFSQRIACAEDWLELEEDDPEEPLVQEKEQELTST